MRNFSVALLAALSVASLSAHADSASAQKLANKYAAIAKHIDTHSTGPSAEEGKAFYNRELIIKGKPVACASCHTSNPAGMGKHMVTGKPIKPLAPEVNHARFGDIDKVEKNFEKHCHEVIGRDCTAQEKANFISYLISVK